MTSKVFICYWDSNGFEVIKDMTTWERQCLLDTISGKALSNPPISLNMLVLRARFNPQRHPEIWTFNTGEDFEEETLWEYANESPQVLVDLIRAKGKKIYGIDKFKDPVIR